MLVSLTVGKVDAGVTVLLTPDKRLIEFPSILLPPNISSGSIVDINVGRNLEKEASAEDDFRNLQDRIFGAFGASEPAAPVLRCRNATQTSVVLEWEPIALATADLISLSLYRNGQKAGNIPRPLEMHSTKISGLAVDTEYSFYLVLRTSSGTRASEKVVVRTHKMTDLSGITITAGVLPAAVREGLARAVERIGAKMVEGVRIDTTHFVTMEGRGAMWEKAVEGNIPVVRPEWVTACEASGRILGVTKFYLDAMRPGMGSEDQLPPPLPGKDRPNAQNGERVSLEAAAAAAASGKRKSVNFEAHRRTSPAVEGQGTRTEQPRVDGTEEHNLTLRPKVESSSVLESPPEETKKEEKPVEEKEKAREVKKEEEKEEKEGEESQASSGERASFQEVEL